MAKAKCPKCAALSSVSEEGKARCPKCKHVFTSPGENAVAAGLPSQNNKAAKKAKAKPPASSSGMLWVLVIVMLLGVMLVGVICIAGAAFYFLSQSPQKQMAVNKTTNEPVVLKEFKDIDGAKKIADRDFWLDKDAGKGLKDKMELPPDRNRAIIREVMKSGFDRNMTRDFTTGKATPEQKQQMIALFTDFAGTRSPRGDNGDWNRRTAALLAAVKADDAQGFAKSSNCAGCHREHKGKR
jgi:hypothetical protein